MGTGKQGHEATGESTQKANPKEEGSQLIHLVHLTSTKGGLSITDHFTEKLSCSVAVEELPTQTSNSDGSTIQLFLAALQ
jgi:hypothetical protein